MTFALLLVNILFVFIGVICFLMGISYSLFVFLLNLVASYLLWKAYQISSIEKELSNSKGNNSETF